MKKQAFLLLLITVLPVAALLACGRAPQPDAVRATVVQAQDAETPQYTFGNGQPCYEIGLNAMNQPVFKELDAAFDGLTSDYADVLAIMRKQFRLPKISRSNWRRYMVYAWQIETDDENLQHRGAEVMAFFDIYENSFAEEADS